MKSKKLEKGDLIGVCSPSGLIKEKHKEEFKNSEKILKEYDLKVQYSDNLFANSLIYSASTYEKSSDINNLIENKDIKAIIFAKGGNNSNSILDLINYQKIKENPKIFMGFSDNTVLLNAINKKTGLVTYHFTNFKGFCEENIEFNRKQFENVFIYGNKGNVDKNSIWKTIRSGVCKGKLVGGNLSSLVKILNTEYSPNFKNKILFIEDLAFESSAEMVSSYLYQLKQSGVFENIRGLLIGNYDTKDDIPLEKIVLDIVKEYDFPIVKCDDFGHTASNIVLPIGLDCTLDANKCILIYDEKPIN